MVIDENVAHEIIGEIKFEASRMKKLSSVAHGLPAEFVDTEKILCIVFATLYISWNQIISIISR